VSADDVTQSIAVERSALSARDQAYQWSLPIGIGRSARDAFNHFQAAAIEDFLVVAMHPRSSVTLEHRDASR
jgi:hypothetical protein